LQRCLLATDVASEQADSADQQPQHPFVVACLKMVGLLVTVETSLELECVMELFPFFAKLFSDSLAEQRQVGGDGAATPVDGSLVSFFVPFLINHSSSVEGCVDLSRHQLLLPLAHYFTLKCRRVRSPGCDSALVDDEEHLTSVCHVFLNLALVQTNQPLSNTEQQLVGEVLHLAVDSLPWLFLRLQRHARLAMTLLTLSLALLRLTQHSGQTAAGAAESPDCACASLVVRAGCFLGSDTFEREDSTQGKRCVWRVCAPLHADWSDCSGLWHLSGQLLADVVSQLAWARSLLQRSGFQESVTRLLPEIRRDLNSEQQEIVESLSLLFKVTVAL